MRTYASSLTILMVLSLWGNVGLGDSVDEHQSRRNTFSEGTVVAVKDKHCCPCSSMRADQPDEVRQESRPRRQREFRDR